MKESFGYVALTTSLLEFCDGGQIGKKSKMVKSKRKRRDHEVTYRAIPPDSG